MKIDQIKSLLAVLKPDTAHIVATTFHIKPQSFFIAQIFRLFPPMVHNSHIGQMLYAFTI